MLNFFRKKKKEKPFSDEMEHFFRSIIAKMPEKYHFLNNGINQDFILEFKPNVLGFKDSYTFVFDANLEKKYKIKNIPDFFIIENILVWNTNFNDYLKLNINILTGFVAGFNLIDINFENYDLNNINTDNINEKHFENKDLIELEKILAKYPAELKDFLDIDQTFRIDILKKDYFVIKNLENGNYVSVDKSGIVYGMIHDPYEIEKLFDNPALLLEALKSDDFSFEDYINFKMN